MSITFPTLSLLRSLSLSLFISFAPLRSGMKAPRTPQSVLAATIDVVRSMLSSSAGKATNHQIAVWAATMMVPRGKVATYGSIASFLKSAGIPSAPQAVGQALRSNPFAPRVPCHRVVAADGQLHGFQGHTTGAPMAKKAALLADEGVRITVQAGSHVSVVPACRVDDLAAELK